MTRGALRIFLLSALLLADAGRLSALTKDAIVGARPMAMGGAFTAVADDYNAAVWNPAAMDLGIFRSQVGFSYARYPEGINQYYMAAIYPTISSGTFGLYLNALDYGAFQRYDDYGNRLPDFSRRDFTGGVAYGKKVRISYKKFVTLLSVGGALKYAYANLTDYSKATGYAADAGAMLSLPMFKNLSFAAVIKNFGGLALKDGAGLRQTLEPSSMRLGASISATEDLLLAADAETLSTGERSYSLGTEFTLLGIKLRGGLLSLQDTVTFCGGVGIGTKSGLTVDYALLNHDALGFSQRLSLGFPFGRDIQKEKRLNECLRRKWDTAIRWLLPDNISMYDKNSAGVFIDKFETDIINERAFKVYERKNIEILSAERKEQGGGVLSPEVKSKYLAKGVTKLLSVIIKVIDGRLSFQIKLADLESGEILLSDMQITSMDPDSLQDTAGKMAKNLVGSFMEQCEKEQISRPGK